jgi:hypothetical protein
MSPAAQDVTEMVVLCDRKPFLAVLLSPWGLLNLLLAPCTMGFTLLLVAGLYFLAMPRRVWLQRGRLFSDKFLPSEGIDLGNIRVKLVNQTLAGAAVNRYVSIAYPDSRGKEHLLGLNQVFYGHEALDRVMAALSEGRRPDDAVLSARPPLSAAPDPRASADLAAGEAMKPSAAAPAVEGDAPASHAMPVGDSDPARAPRRQPSRKRKVLLGVAVGLLLLILVLVAGAAGFVGFPGFRGKDSVTQPTPTGTTEVVAYEPWRTHDTNTQTQPTLDWRLVGTWHQETHKSIRTTDDVFIYIYHRFITIDVEGRFSDKTNSGASSGNGTVQSGAHGQGRVVQSGNTLTFLYDNGRQWTVNYQLVGTDGLCLGGGELYLKQ